MHFPRILLTAAAFLGLFVSGLASYGQQPDPGRVHPKGQMTTITGCLTKGESPDQYVLINSDNGSKIVVTGAADLEKHAASHTVKLTGTSSEDGRSFTASRVEQVAESCTATK